MEILYVLIPLSIVLISLAVVIFSWAVKSGQFDDLEGPAHSILFDDDQALTPTDNTKPKSSSSAKTPDSSAQP